MYIWKHILKYLCNVHYRHIAMYITNHIINVHGMTLQMYTKCTLEYKYVMYFVQYIYKVHLKWFVKYI
jgi:hypothetical protein